MAKVTYYDREKAAPRVVFQGVEFEHKEPVELDEIEHATLIRLAEANPFFEVAARASGAPSRAYGKGADAAAARKERNVPVAYRGKPDAAQWLAGFDHKTEELAAEASREA